MTKKNRGLASSNFVIAIPSYQRPHQQETVQYLSRLGFPRERIFLFIKPQEVEEYKKAWGDKATVVSSDDSNIAQARNNALRYFALGTEIVMLDDDLKWIEKRGEIKDMCKGQKYPSKQKLDTLVKFKEFINLGFQLCRESNTILFGTNLTDNSVWPSSGNPIEPKGLVHGRVLGIINTKGMRFNPEFIIKEDFEFCCQVLRKYGAVIKLKRYVACVWDTKRGGCREQRDKLSPLGIGTFAERLVKEYPDLLRFNKREPGEILFRHEIIKHPYGSPRWSGEFLDCSVPMTFDTYSVCSYNCLYCFSYFQKARSNREGDYETRTVKAVDPLAVERIFTGEAKSQFDWYVQNRFTMQWGGLADPFDEYERRFGVGLQLLQFFRKIKYPITFSTKATWWVEDERYRVALQGADHFHIKVSIINLDERLAHLVERGAPTPMERLQAIRQISTWGLNRVVLRLRPFIIGMSDRNDEYLELIRLAAKYGARAVSMEFMCLERRTRKERFEPISQALGFDVLDFYVKNSTWHAGYMRLNREIKRPYVEKMDALCKDLGLGFYVSDAHFKERSVNPSCCGIGDKGKCANYFKGHFLAALLYAKKHGEVRWKDMHPQTEFWKRIPFCSAHGFNTQSARVRALRFNQTLYDVMRTFWNSPNRRPSPAQYFGNILEPVGLDEDKNVIYRYNYELE